MRTENFQPGYKACLALFMSPPCTNPQKKENQLSGSKDTRGKCLFAAPINAPKYTVASRSTQHYKYLLEFMLASWLLSALLSGTPALNFSSSQPSLPAASQP